MKGSTRLWLMPAVYMSGGYMTDMEKQSIILDVVANEFNIFTDEIISKTRKREVLLPRQVAQYFTFQYTSLPLRSIGEHIGKKKHCTVIHSVSIVRELLETNRILRNQCANIDVKLRKYFGMSEPKKFYISNHNNNISNRIALMINKSHQKKQKDSYIIRSFDIDFHSIYRIKEAIFKNNLNIVKKELVYG